MSSIDKITAGVFNRMKNPVQMATAVLPDGEGEKRKVRVADEEETSKKQKSASTVAPVKYVMKNKILAEGATLINFCGAHPELFLERLQGNIELVWCDNGTKEGFIDPFVKAFFHYDKKNPNAVKTFEELKKKTGIFVGVSRRISREVNQSQLKEGNNNGMFKLTYSFVVASRTHLIWNRNIACVWKPLQM
jgi:hypothetical protein